MLLLSPGYPAWAPFLGGGGEPRDFGVLSHTVQSTVVQTEPETLSAKALLQLDTKCEVIGGEPRRERFLAALFSLCLGAMTAMQEDMLPSVLRVKTAANQSLASIRQLSLFVSVCTYPLGCFSEGRGTLLVFQFVSVSAFLWEAQCYQLVSLYVCPLHINYPIIHTVLKFGSFLRCWSGAKLWLWGG